MKAFTFRWIRRKLFPINTKWIHRKSAGVFVQDGNGEIDLIKTSPSVTWNMDRSLAVLMRNWLRLYAKHTPSYPFDYEGTDDNGLERWKNKVLEIADLFNDYMLDYFTLQETEEGHAKLASFVAEYDALNRQNEVMDSFERTACGVDDIKMAYVQAERIKTAMAWLGENWGMLWE